MVIRPATVDDVSDIAEIFNQSIRTSVASMHTEPRTPAQQRQWYESLGDNYPVLIAEQNGKVVGWASLGPWENRFGYRHSAETSIYIDEASVGQGIGSRLMESLIDSARERGFHLLVARISDLGSEDPEQASLRLHAKFGFELVGTMREVGQKFDRWVDVHIMQLLLE